MRQGFRKTLNIYAEITKDAQKISERAKTNPDADAVDEFHKLGAVIDWNLDQRARTTGTDTKVQKRILEIQGIKQKKMLELKDALKRIANNETEPTQTKKNQRSVVGEDGKLFWTFNKGQRLQITQGEIISDLAWGVEYQLDPKSTSKQLRKRLALERAKRELLALLDEQIMTEESQSSQTDQGRRKAYEALRETKEHGRPGLGHVAEQIVTQYLTKKIIDEKLPYRISKADAYQDVAQKIDFIIRRLEHHRGVNVNSAEIETKGIQFTINSSYKTQAHKKAQIAKSRERLAPTDRIDDIVLVTMDMRTVAEAYDEWKRNRLPGGPDRFLPESIKQKLFEAITKDME